MNYSVFVETINNSGYWEFFEDYEDAYDYFVDTSTNDLRRKISVDLYQEINDESVLLKREVIK